MSDNLLIRDEKECDFEIISSITEEAFRPMEISSHTEHFIVEALRAAKALTVSLVAEIDGEVLGHIAISPVSISDGSEGWYGLGPRKGVGKALIKESLKRITEFGEKAKGVCLVGHPTYYRQFGFENTVALTHGGIPPEVFFVLPLNGNDEIPKGIVEFHEGFKADGKK